MQALVLRSREAGVIFETDYTTPQPAAGEVSVRLHAAALNHRDVWITQGLYPGIKYPTILGSDGMGEVVAVGDGVAAEQLHRKVIINPNNNWGDNPRFQQPDYHILGLPKNGTLAEYLTVATDRLHDAPPHLSAAQAAALPLAGLTAYRALIKRADVQPKERVLISGVGGGVALCALQFAVAAGAEVYVTSSSAEKIARAVAMGAVAGFDYNTADWHKTLVKTHGEMDVVIDSAAGSGFAQLVDTLAFGGRIVFYGGTHGNITQLAPAKIFWKHLSILGSTMGSDADFAAMLAFVNQHKIVPVVDSVYTLKDGLSAFRQMERGAQFGKIVVDTIHEL
jgi:zinc-binding alcohol dehydrogenase/oxidoreductase